VLLAALTSFVVWRCRRGDARLVLWSVVVVGALAVVKAAAIHYSGIFAIGSFDRIQASSYYSAGQLRTILVGGDTLLILVPCTSVLLASQISSAPIRLGLAIVGLACLGALDLSVTRTSIVVALGLVALAVAGVLLRTRPRLTRGSGAVGAALIVLAVAVPLVGGLSVRLFRKDPPHVGLNFRRDEVDSFLKLPGPSKYLGQGLGGRFLSKDVNGKPVRTAWAHELPVWIALKDGILGLVCGTVALVVIASRCLRSLRRGSEPTLALAGGIYVVGLVVMSLTLDRVALVEGAIPLVVAVFLLSPRPPISDPTV
jgi:hypothetical protein